MFRKSRPLKASPQKRRRSFRPLMEVLEERLALSATITVNSTLDSDARDDFLTLREAIHVNNRTLAIASLTAIEQAQVTGTPTSTDRDTIAFNIPGSGVRTISPSTNLPTITDPVIIDGYTQPGTNPNTLPVGNNATLLVELNGGSVNSGVGLMMFAGSSAVRGLVVNRWFTTGIWAAGNSNVVEGNFVGTDSTGAVAPGGQRVGIEVSSNGTIIGGVAPAARNLISGNSSFGVSEGGNGNLIQGNYIGTNRAGTAPLANRGGVDFRGAGSTLGGTTAGAGNVISGNAAEGVSFANTGFVHGNFIGTDPTGMAALGNSTGVYMNGTGGALGGTAPGMRNIISGNATGVYLAGQGASIQGNFIGTNVNGSAALANSTGVYIAFGSNYLIGGASAGAGNVISGNLSEGLFIFASGNTVQGNRIGTTADGLGALGNQSRGVFLFGGNNNLIGGAASGEGNVIAHNSGGVLLSGSTGNQIISNSIYSNAGPGISISLASAPTTNTIRSNSIHSNVGLGIDLEGGGVTLNDLGDADTGANGLQNFPELTSASSSGGSTTILGTLNSKPSTIYTLEFFASAVADPSGFGEGQTYLGAATVTTDAAGNASFTVTLPVAVPAGHVFTSTATDPNGNTSEFSGNRPPTAAANSYSVNEDGTLTVAAPGPLTNDSDPDGNPLTAVLVAGPANGTLTLNANGSFTYAPSANFFGIDSFTYKAQDNWGNLSNTATVTLTVNAVNDVPGFTMRTDVSVALSSTNGAIAHGSVRVNNGQIGGGSSYATYYNSLPVLPPFQSPTGAGGRFAKYPGIGSDPFFIYAKLDGAGAFAFTQTGTTLGIPSGNGTFTNPGTYLPTAAHTGTLGLPLFLPNGTVLAAGTTIYSDYAGLSVDLNDPASYWLDSATGVEHRTYRAGSWSFYTQNAGTFTKFAEYADVTQSFLINFGTGAVTSTWTATPVPINGFVLPATGSSSVAEAINTTGILDNEKISPFTGFYGRFPHSLSITFDVEGVTVAEDAGPRAVANWATNITKGPANESGQTLSFLVTNNNTGLFSVQPTIAANGTLTFTPAANKNGTATVTVRLKDNGGTANGGVDTSAAQTFTITVTPVNDAPIANNDSLFTSEDTPVTANVLANDRPGPTSATDEASQTLSVTMLNGVAAAVGQVVATVHGSVVRNANGTVTYTPAANYNGPDSFSYTVTDSGAPPASATANGIVTINPVNDAPILVTTEATLPAIDEDDVNNTGTSLPAFIATLTITDVDAGAVKGIAVNGVDNAHGAWQYSIDGGSTWTAFGSPSNTSARLLTDNTTNRIRFVPAPNYFGPATFTFRAWDRTSGANGGIASTSSNGGTTAFSSAIGTATITVNPLNRAPVAGGDSYSTNEDTPLVVAAPGVLSNDTDADNDLLTAIKVSDPSHGSLTLNADGYFIYIPAPNYFGPDSFSYKVSDGSLESNVVTESLTIIAVNNAPVADAAVNQGADEGQVVQFDGAGSSDVDGDALTYAWNFGDGSTATGPTPIHAYADNGSYTVTLTVGDGRLTSTDTLTVLVNNVRPTATLAGGGPVNEAAPATVSFSAPFDPSGADTSAGFRYSYDFNNDGDFADAGEAADVTAASRSFTFGDNGVYVVRGRISDKDGGYNDYLTEITVNNLAPTAANDAASTDEDLAVRIPVLGNDADPAGAFDPLQIVSVANGAKGTASIDTKGTPNPADDEILYTPNAGATGSDTITYTISDGDGGTAAGNVTVQIRNLVDLMGRVFDDKDNDGLYEPGEGDVGIGGVSVQLLNQTSGAIHAMRTTAVDGTYVFDVNLGAGVYKVVAAQSAGYLDGRDTAGNLGGAVDNSQDSNQIANINVGPAGTMLDAVDYLFAEIGASQGHGLVWSDFNNDGEVNFGERAIQGVNIELTGLDDRGNSVSRSTTTDANGIYAFSDLRPSNSAGYTIREMQQPTGYTNGIDALGTVNGVASGNTSINDSFSVVVLPRPSSLAENYNFGERPSAEGSVTGGQTATIGFWQNKNGQSLINALNGGSTSTQLGNWLAATLPNMYAALVGKTNAQVAEFYKTLFARTASSAAGGGPAKMDAQVLAVTLATYVTNQTLAGTAAAAYGFLVTQNGLGTRTFNVGTSGAAFGVANHSTVTVLDLLLAVNFRSRNGLLYDLDGDGDATDSQEALFRTMANDVFSAINESGDI